MPNLHIGGDLVISGRDLLGIFSNISRNSDFIAKHRDNFRIKNESGKNRSFILIKRGKDSYIYYSKVSASKLIKRFDEQISGGR
jgi:hypothetical protein